MPSTGQIILPQFNSSGNWDEKLITPESGKVLGFDASLNPVMVSIATETEVILSGVSVTNNTSDITNHIYFNAGDEYFLEFFVVFTSSFSNCQLGIFLAPQTGTYQIATQGMVNNSPYISHSVNSVAPSNLSVGLSFGYQLASGLYVVGKGTSHIRCATAGSIKLLGRAVTHASSSGTINRLIMKMRKL